jgi:template-activating factor I
VEDEPDIKSGFTVTFCFAENPYFSNAELQKKICYLEDGTTEITSVPPQWRPGKVSPA